MMALIKILDRDSIWFDNARNVPELAAVLNRWQLEEYSELAVDRATATRFIQLGSRIVEWSEAIEVTL